MDGSREAAPADSEPPAADQPGVVSFEYETHPPEVGGQLQAVLLDPDIVVSGDVVMDLAALRPTGTTWEAIDGATGDTYTATVGRRGALPAGHGRLCRRPRAGQDGPGRPLRAGGGGYHAP